MAVRLRLDGSITDSSFDALENAVATENRAKETTLIIDMAGVDFMSSEAARQICRMRNERMRLINCSPFIATLLHTCQDKVLNDEKAV